MRALNRRRRVAALGGAIIALLLLPSLVVAHPLGNFTINHYAGIRIEPDRILLDVVIDQAEIPAFQARLGFDVDGDGGLSAAEVDSGRVAACQKLVPMLDLEVTRTRPGLELVEAGLAFPPGVSGLSTMRQVCEFTATPAAPITAGTAVAFADRSFPERLGWREIVVEGSRVTLTGAPGSARTAGVSDRLTHYPTTLLSQALADLDVTVTASPGGPALPPLDMAGALLILLGSIAAGRPGFGFMLVVAFGLGMALVMGGIGLALVVARGRLPRVDGVSPFSRLGVYLPLVASFVVLGLGLYLTVQAVSGTTTF